MTKSGFLVFTANRETDRQTTKYLKDPDVTVKMRLCAITELEFVIPAASFTNEEKKAPKGCVKCPSYHRAMKG